MEEGRPHQKQPDAERGGAGNQAGRSPQPRALDAFSVLDLVTFFHGRVHDALDQGFRGHRAVMVLELDRTDHPALEGGFVFLEIQGDALVADTPEQRKDQYPEEQGGENGPRRNAYDGDRGGVEPEHVDDPSRQQQQGHGRHHYQGSAPQEYP